MSVFLCLLPRDVRHSLVLDTCPRTCPRTCLAAAAAPLGERLPLNGCDLALLSVQTSVPRQQVLGVAASLDQLLLALRQVSAS